MASSLFEFVCVVKCAATLCIPLEALNSSINHVTSLAFYSQHAYRQMYNVTMMQHHSILYKVMYNNNDVHNYSKVTGLPFTL